MATDRARPAQNAGEREMLWYCWSASICAVDLASAAFHRASKSSIFACHFASHS